MKSRERVLTALDHKEPDRIPIDLGGTVVSSIAIPTYIALRQYLGLPEKSIETLEVVQQVARIDEDMLERFGVDVIPVFANPPDTPPPLFSTSSDGTMSFKDDFGATLKKHEGCNYFDWQEFPLPEPSVEAMRKMPWPDPANRGRYAGLRERVKNLRSSTDRALFSMAPCGHDLFNQLFRVRGMENGMIDLVAEPDFVEAFFDRLCDTICAAQKLFLTEVGDLIDVHFAADDLSGQRGPLIAPELYRRIIKPRQARIIATIKAHTKAPVFYHSCGAIDEFIPDLIEIGVNIINPVQVSASGMETAQLKKKYGGNLSFWGGGCDTQKVLPFGTPEETRAEVRRRIRDLAPGGGFVFNPVHNIQAGVPAAIITAMFDEAMKFGKYPLDSKKFT